MKLKFLCCAVHIALFLQVISPTASSSSDEFKNKFFIAKSHLARGHTEEALPIYKELYETDSNNANISYLLGVCYTEEKEVTAQSIYFLERGAKNVSEEYDPGADTEHNAPIFVWYYLAIAYSQNSMCAKALKASNHFKSLYGAHKNDFYTNDAMRWVSKCNKEALGKDDKTPPLKDRNIVTKPVEYTAKTPLYAIQVGAFSRLVPIWKFDKLNNVDAFMDKDGLIRYAIGHFNYVPQANVLLKVIWEAGYRDAFIVDVNSTKRTDDQRFTEEIVSVDEVSFKAKVQGKVDFRVQVGAFKDSIPEELVQLYLTLEGLQENRYQGLTTLTVGAYPTYELASVKKQEMVEFGIPGAFVTAYNYDRKIPVDEANHHLEKNAEKQRDKAAEKD